MRSKCIDQVWAVRCMFFAASFACAHSWNKNGIASVGIDIYKLNTPGRESFSGKPLFVWLIVTRKRLPTLWFLRLVSDHRLAAGREGSGAVWSMPISSATCCGCSAATFRDSCGSVW